MHKRLNLLTLEERQSIKMACECHKHVYSGASLSKFFVEKAIVRQTRHTSKFKVPCKTTEIERRACSYRGPYCWNLISDNITNPSNFTSFKTTFMKLFP